MKWYRKKKTRSRGTKCPNTTSCWLFEIYYLKPKEHQQEIPASSGGQSLSVGEAIIVPSGYLKAAPLRSSPVTKTVLESSPPPLGCAGSGLLGCAGAGAAGSGLLGCTGVVGADGVTGATGAGLEGVAAALLLELLL